MPLFEDAGSLEKGIRCVSNAKRFGDVLTSSSLRAPLLANITRWVRALSAEASQGEQLLEPGQFVVSRLHSGPTKIACREGRGCLEEKLLECAWSRPLGRKSSVQQSTERAHSDVLR